jgi:hypothetical protein
VGGNLRCRSSTLAFPVLRMLSKMLKNRRNIVRQTTQFCISKGL